jgi:hypothetical protein
MKITIKKGMRTAAEAVIPTKDLGNFFPNSALIKKPSSGKNKIPK